MTFSYNWDETFRMMVQSLLEDRFKLRVHQEQKSLSVYALTVSRGGPRLQRAAETGRPRCTRTVDRQLAAETHCRSMTMPDALEKQLGLKLEARKQPMPVIVIDSIERPSDN